MGGVSNPPTAANPDLAIWNASKLQGNAISDQAPNDGDVYVWSAANNRFEPAAVAGGQGSIDWGEIGGTLGDQADLQGALDAKADSGAIANFETTTQLNARDTANRDRANHTGTQAIGTVNGLQTALDAKADSGAIANFETTTQLNARDTANRDRTNHTGTQAIATVNGLQAALDSIPTEGWQLDETVAANSWALNTEIVFDHSSIFGGQKPGLVYVVFICESANNGYAVGDEIPLIYSDFIMNNVRVTTSHIRLWIEGVSIRPNFNISSTRASLSPSQWGIRVRASIDPPVLGGSSGGWLASTTGIAVVRDTPIEFTHGLGREPKDFLMGFRLTDAVGGYSIGDFVPFSSVGRVANITWNATLIRVILDDHFSFTAIDNTNGNYLTTGSNTELEIYVK